MQVNHDNRIPLTHPKDGAQFFSELIAFEPGEMFGILFLTTKHRLIGFHEASRGTLDSCFAHPSEVFKAAILSNAAAIIVVKGWPAPSLWGFFKINCVER